MKRADMEVKPTREHRALAAKIQYKYDNWLEGGPVALWIEDGHPRAIVREAIPTAELLASFGEAAEERGRRLEREAVIRFLNAQPTGFSLPSCAQAIGSEVHLATPAAPEEPALELKCSACGGSGESQNSYPRQSASCERCSGTGKEPT